MKDKIQAFVNYVLKRPLIFTFIYLILIPSFAAYYCYVIPDGIISPNSRFEKRFDFIKSQFTRKILDLTGTTFVYSYTKMKNAPKYSQILSFDNVSVYEDHISISLISMPGLFSFYGKNEEIINPNDLFNQIRESWSTSTENERNWANIIYQSIQNNPPFQFFHGHISMSIYPYSHKKEFGMTSICMQFKNKKDLIKISSDAPEGIFLAFKRQPSPTKPEDHWLLQSDNSLDRCLSKADFAPIIDVIDEFLGKSISSGQSFPRMLYFSVVVLTTLGLGDIIPISDHARFAVGLEAILGIVVMGFFINSVSNIEKN